MFVVAMNGDCHDFLDEGRGRLAVLQGTDALSELQLLVLPTHSAWKVVFSFSSSIVDIVVVGA